MLKETKDWLKLKRPEKVQRSDENARHEFDGGYEEGQTRSPWQAQRN